MSEGQRFSRMAKVICVKVKNLKLKLERFSRRRPKKSITGVSLTYSSKREPQRSARDMRVARERVARDSSRSPRALLALSSRSPRAHLALALKKYINDDYLVRWSEIHSDSNFRNLVHMCM